MFRLGGWPTFGSFQVWGPRSSTAIELTLGKPGRNLVFYTIEVVRSVFFSVGSPHALTDERE
jgi:hypothetical protein